MSAGTKRKTLLPTGAARRFGLARRMPDACDDSDTESEDDMFVVRHSKPPTLVNRENDSGTINNDDSSEEEEEEATHTDEEDSIPEDSGKPVYVVENGTDNKSIETEENQKTSSPKIPKTVPTILTL